MAPKILIAILAAGLGRRMAPQLKMLAPWQGRPLLEHALRAAKAARPHAVTVITGHHAEALSPLLSQYSVTARENPAYDSGLASSLKVAVTAARTASCDGLLVMLGDMPLITDAHLTAVMADFAAHDPKPVVRATDQGRPGHPTLLPAALFPALATLHGDQGAKHLLAGWTGSVRTVEIGAAARFDLDTPEALAQGAAPSKTR